MQLDEKSKAMKRMMDGMRALGDEEMAELQAKASEGIRQRGPLTSLEMASAQNFWPFAAEPVPTAPKPTRWQRLKQWFSGG